MIEIDTGYKPLLLRSSSGEEYDFEPSAGLLLDIFDERATSLLQIMDFKRESSQELMQINKYVGFNDEVVAKQLALFGCGRIAVQQISDSQDEYLETMFSEPDSWTLYRLKVDEYHPISQTDLETVPVLFAGK